MPKLTLHPRDDILLPSMRYIRAAGKADIPNVVFLEFQTTETSHGPGCHHQSEKSTIRLPITSFDAAGLLRTLKQLQQAGLIPHVAEPNLQSQSN